jgi:hypothetical protein
MAVRRPLVYLLGFPVELPTGDTLPLHPRSLANPGLADLEDGELAVDAATAQLVWRAGPLLYRYSADAAQSTPGGMDFSSEDNSIWVGHYL